MKRIRKLASLLLALAMILSMTTAAFAAQEGELTGGSITINDAVPEQTYNTYQVLYLESYNASSHAYSYKANSDWEAWLKTQTAYVSFDAQGYVTWVEGASAADFAKAAQKYAKDNNIDPAVDAVTANSSTVEFTGLKLGYYLIDTTLGTLCSLDTTNPSVVMEEKNAAPENVKTVEENSTNEYGARNDANIGDTVNFKSTITAQAGAENYVFHDKMSTGLTYIEVTGITLNGATVDASNYEAKTAELGDDCTFHVVFNQAFCDTLKANDQIVISYSATINENAVIGGDGNKNESKLSYGDKNNTKTTPPSETKTYTWDVDVFKYTMDGQSEEALSGATFALSKNDDGTNSIALVVEGNNVYRVAKTGETDTVTEITTDTTGKFTIKGLDSATYYLTEIVAPAGYNKLAGPITIVVNNDGTTSVGGETVNEVKVLNQSGTELPSTGGIGTTIFYAAGIILMAGAIFFVVRRKKA